jgi:tRNA U34 5-carboxymethylaminomethyl modifying enzyme MnmG/GidA
VRHHLDNGLKNSRALEMLAPDGISVERYLQFIPALSTIPLPIRERLGWEGEPSSLRKSSDHIARYAGYVQREREYSALLLKDEELKLPDDLDYFRHDSH